MGISINIQRIKRAKAVTTKGWSFSTVRLITESIEHMWDADAEVCLFLEGAGHEDCAARIAALINEQVIRRDTPKVECSIFPDPEPEDEEAAYEQERQQKEQAVEERRQRENDELARAYPRLRDREERSDDAPF